MHMQQTPAQLDSESQRKGCQNGEFGEVLLITSQIGGIMIPPWYARK